MYIYIYIYIYMPIKDAYPFMNLSTYKYICVHTQRGMHMYFYIDMYTVQNPTVKSQYTFYCPYKYMYTYIIIHREACIND
jgi:hypothetical protein